MKQFYVYILSSKTGTLYTGITNDLQRRLCEHKHKLVPGFTAKYGCDRLMYYEVFPTADQAIAAEKRIKGWTRAKKVALVKTKDPEWLDLSLDWGPGGASVTVMLMKPPPIEASAGAALRETASRRL